MRSHLIKKDPKRIGFFLLSAVILITFATWAYFVKISAETGLKQRCDSLIADSLDRKNGVLVIKSHELVDFINYVCEQNPSADLHSQRTLQMIQQSLQLNKSKDDVNTTEIAKMGFFNFLSPLILQYSKLDKAHEVVIQDELIWTERPKDIDFDSFYKTLGANGDFQWATFDKYSVTGSTPKIRIKDMQERRSWNLKWGDEVHTDPVASRLFFKLGYNVDYGVYKSKDSLKLILNPETDSDRSVSQFIRFLYNIYRVDLTPFIDQVREVSEDDVAKNPFLKPYLHKTYLTFKSSFIEFRNDQEFRIGPAGTSIEERSEYKASLLAHIWLGNWDTKNNNTLVTLEKNSDSKFRFRFYFNDLGASLGVHINLFPRDLKAGLVNEFDWQIGKVSNEEIQFTTHHNSISAAYRKATYSELKWMAEKISSLSQTDIQSALKKSGWPEEIQTLYFNKLLSRQANIVEVFDLKKVSILSFTKDININRAGKALIQNGELIEEYDLEQFPEGFLNRNGRFRAFGWKK